jgi:Adenylate and Guanylate cyclase catalytic domain
VPLTSPTVPTIPITDSSSRKLPEEHLDGAVSVETLTFLFTDIEGSTALLRRLGEGVYAQVLADHRSLIRSGLAAHGGEEVVTEGDAFFTLSEVRQTSEEPVGVGATMIYAGTFLGRRYESPVQMSAYPVLMHTALDATDCRGLAEFYRQFLGLRYRPGPRMMYRSRCITTSAWPVSGNCSVNGGAPKSSGPPCCTTVRTTTVSRCMCSLTPPGIPSVFLSVLRSEPRTPGLTCGDFDSLDRTGLADGAGAELAGGGRRYGAGAVDGHR